MQLFLLTIQKDRKTWLPIRWRNSGKQLPLQNFIKIGLVALLGDSCSKVDFIIVHQWKIFLENNLTMLVSLFKEDLILVLWILKMVNILTSMNTILLWEAASKVHYLLQWLLLAISHQLKSLAHISLMVPLFGTLISSLLSISVRNKVLKMKIL